MAKQFFPLLPKLKEASAVNPDKSGVWEDESQDFLSALIKSLAVGGTIKEIGSIDSIPDVWARPLLFQMALFDEQKTEAQQFVKGLHERVLGEWRCLLAMLALKEAKQLDLRAEAVHIGREGSSLEEILLMLSPRESIARSTSWTNLYVLFYRDVPIAMTSPTTLVAAAADYRTAFGGTLPEPWSKDGATLSDPIDCLTEEDRASLYGWVSMLYEELRSTVPRAEQETSASCMSILRCLDSYRQDIGRSCLSSPSPEVSRTDSGLNLNMGVFRLLNQAVRPKPATAQDSQVRLLPSEGREPKHALLLVSPDMVRKFAEQLGIPATQLIVWRGLSANDVSEGSLQGERKRIGRISMGNAEWRRPEEFFTEKMAVMEPGNTILGSRPIDGAQILAEDDLSAILPVTRELLEYFTAEEIAERISIENMSDDICVHFSFPLSGVAGGPANYRFTKRYSKKDLIYLQNNVPVVEIWPNFRREGWKKYYLYYENSEAQNRSSTNAGKDFFYVDPWTYGEEIGRDVPNHGLSNRYTAQLGGFPEALLCTVNTSAAGCVEAGALLLAQPPLAEGEMELAWQVGIDFGTSSTMIYAREDSKQPMPLAFRPHLFQVTKSGVARTSTFINFIPYAMEAHADGSFLSIFHMLNMEALHREILPLRDGHVFLLTTKNTAEFRQQGKRIDTNLKWKDDDAGRRKVAAYIKQICIQCAAEAACAGADRLQWNFSFPTAFSREQQFTFRATCQEAVDEACHATCFPSSAIEPWPESKASAYYFNKLGRRDTNFSDGAICLDIGAGTTDISIISGQPGRIVYHTSIQFAGRCLFLPIYRRYRLFRPDLQDFGDVEEEQRQAILDADMREHGEDCLRNLKHITGHEEVKRVLEVSQLAMAGIFHYLGELLSFLQERGIYEEEHVPDIFVGGNGARILAWLTGGMFDTENPFLDPLKNVIAASSGLSGEERFAIRASGSPKVEVACGMIETRPQNDREFYDEQRQARDLFGHAVDEYTASAMVSGEAFSAGDRVMGKHAMLSAQDIAGGIKVERLEELGRFLEVFRRSPNTWFEGAGVDDGQLQETVKLVNSYYVAEKGKDARKIFVEPVFIMALKKWMEVLVHEYRYL